MSTDDIVIRTNGLTKRFGENTAVDGLSMEVQRGRVYGLLGPNGSGKTTTIGMLLGLLKPTAGSFSLFGLEGHHDATLRRVGAIIETPSFYPYLSGKQNLTYFQTVSGGGPRNEPDDLLERVGLSSRGDDKYRTYSLGMKQRLGIAYALLGDPDLVFLDEPTNGLDPAGVIEMRELIRSLGGGNRTVLLSSHLLHEVEQTCDSVTIISRGRLVAQGPVAQLVASGGREQVRLRTTDDERAGPILAALEWVSDVAEQNGAMLVTAPIDRCGEITASLAGSEVWVTEMTPVQTSLEDYFLEVTREDDSDSATTPDDEGAAS